MAAMQCLCSAGFGHAYAVLVPGLFQGEPFISDLPGCLWKKKASREICLQRCKPIYTPVVYINLILHLSRNNNFLLNFVTERLECRIKVVIKTDLPHTSSSLFTYKCSINFVLHL